MAIQWAEERAREVAESGTPLDDRGFEMARAVGVQRPERIRLALVQAIPLPEHPGLRAAARQAGLLGPDTRGLTLGYSVLLRRGHDSPRLRSHEFRHVHQYETAGSIAAFLPLYLRQILELGYDDAPFEIDARAHEIST